VVNAVSNLGFSGGISAAQDRANVSRDDFMKILVTELSSQDPLEPMDNSQFLDQLIGLQTLDQSAAMTDGLRTFQNFMEMSYGSSLVGKNVKALGNDGELVEGLVSKVVVEDGSASVVVDNKKIPVSAVREILATVAG
jgi:flagellar basal-body rod modification protein FlgD